MCKSWSDIIQQDKRASLRRRSHLSEVEATPEVGNVATAMWLLENGSNVSGLVLHGTQLSVKQAFYFYSQGKNVCSIVCVVLFA